MLEDVRRQYHFLTYLRPEHLWVLHTFFFEENGLKVEAIQEILGFINPSVKPQVPDTYANRNTTLYDVLCLIGKYLDKVFGYILIKLLILLDILDATRSLQKN